jgi:hypothetical protein
MIAAEELEINQCSTILASDGYPEFTRATPEQLMHVGALARLFKAEEPLAIHIRPSGSGKYRYYVGDASTEGWGGATQFPDGRIRGRWGAWESSFAQGGPSLCEAQNQVNHLKDEIQAGLHD